MGLFKDLAGWYAEQASGHVGMHYAGSFNDLNSGVADDADEMVMRESGGHAATLGEVMGSPPGRGRDDHMSAGAGPEARRTTNKADDWPAFGSMMGDIHKVNVGHNPRLARHMYDLPVGPDGHRTDPSKSPSVWDILSGRTGGSTVSFHDLDHDRDGYVTREDIQRTLMASSTPMVPRGFENIMGVAGGGATAAGRSARTSSSSGLSEAEAAELVAAAVQAADRNSDGRLSADEYEAFLDTYSG